MDLVDEFCKGNQLFQKASLHNVVELATLWDSSSFTKVNISCSCRPPSTNRLSSNATDKMNPELNPDGFKDPYAWFCSYSYKHKIGSHPRSRT